MLENEVHIIGGGISGLYLALLLSSHKHLKIHVYEKQSHFGGRIRTEYDKEGRVLFETGPWRIHPSHKNMLLLIQKLQLKKQEIRQTIQNQFSNTNKKEKKIELNNTVTEYQRDCFEESIDFANQKMLESGYDMLLQRANGTRAYSYQTYEDTDRFFVLEDGFSSIIKGIVSILEKCPNVFLYCNFHVTDVSFEKSIYTMHVNIRKENEFHPKRIKAKCLVIATPPSVIRMWKSLTLFPNTSMVSSLPLIHVYGKLKKDEKWNMEHRKEVVNSPISQIIASTFGNQWCQISYASGRFAMMLQNLLIRGKDVFHKYILSEFQRYRKSTITEVKPFFWRNAVHYWNPNLPSVETNMMKRCIQPHRRKYPHLYWIGEAISTKQGWMEGAIETSNHVYKLLKKRDKTLKTKMPKEYVIYDGRILNVEKWKHVHPGSQEAIENHLYQDITHLWNTYHPQEAAKYMVLLEDV